MNLGFYLIIGFFLTIVFELSKYSTKRPDGSKSVIMLLAFRVPVNIVATLSAIFAILVIAFLDKIEGQNQLDSYAFMTGLAMFGAGLSFIWASIGAIINRISRSTYS